MVQVFIPCTDVKQIATTLDYKRLGKAKMVIDIIRGTYEKNAYRNHPIVKMWAPYVEFLKMYYNEIVKEWIRRGYKNTMPLEDVSEKIETPSWWGDEELHSTHRANLLRKDPEYYGQFGWKDTPRVGYLWIVDGKRRLITGTVPKKKTKKTSKKRKSTTKDVKKRKSVHSTEDVKIEDKKKKSDMKDKKQISTSEDVNKSDKKILVEKTLTPTRLLEAVKEELDIVEKKQTSTRSTEAVKEELDFVEMKRKSTRSTKKRKSTGSTEDEKKSKSLTKRRKNSI